MRTTVLWAMTAIIITAIVCGTLLVGTLAWLTPYSYVGPSNAVRVHRYTGRTEFLNLRKLSAPHQAEPAWIAR